MDKNIDLIKAEAAALLEAAMTIDLGREETFYYDVLDPDPNDEDREGQPRLLFVMAIPVAVALTPMGPMVMDKTMGAAIPMDPLVMRNVLNKLLAKLDDMYPVDAPGPLQEELDQANDKAQEEADRLGLPK
jgi:hypothetical protein